MKRILLASALVSCLMSASAQDIIERPTFGDNWQIGLDGGITTPLKGHSFFQNIRPTVGVHIGKQISPLFGLGVEGIAGINTSSVNGGRHSKTAFDNTYVGAYGAFNLTNAFAGFSCDQRPVTVEAVAGIGWLHDYVSYGSDHSNIGAKAGLNFNFNVTDHFSISLKPSVLWNVTGNGTAYRDQGLDLKRANFNLMVGLNYNFGPGFQCVSCPDYSGEISDLNSRVNALRAEVNGKDAALAAANAKNQELTAALAAANSKPAQVKVVKENNLESVRYVFFKIGSSTITADQQPNIEMIAAYLNNHPKSTVQVRGYASADGPVEVNERLAKARAESVKNALIKRYKINPDRINAEGEGIGHMFSEESWNRVSICTLDAD
ncbi:MAG: OmpA family protein [Duncaniella sp.]|uniref:OmpA family protein n=1 Tax=Duncaniella sp. TaxID=2518496 RepID=UPI0019A3DFD1|nr:OmpA family protein [Duncaniella sp.]MBD5313269.1 OmpA family protein [Bacteroides sp.]MDE6091070.1 OmpA family protein [Duncaniella sp.]